MCGLVGMLGNINEPEKRMFRDLLMIDQIRGQDSTGIIAIPLGANNKYGDDNGVIVDKCVGGAMELWEYDSSNLYDFRGKILPAVKALIGHNRAATYGAVNIDNAHPFQFGDIYGAHNGSLTDWYGLDGFTSLEVDSQAVFNTINLRGIDHTWKNFSGAAALTWWDASDETVNIAKNSERPLHIAYSKDRKTLFWASEAGMITLAASRNKVELLRGDNGAISFTSPKLDHVYKIRPSGVGFSLLEERELEKKVYPTNVGYFRGIGGSTTTTKTPTFQPVMGWKKFSHKTAFPRNEITISNLRRISIPNKKGNVEDLFRLDLLRKAGERVGYLDILPRNQKEFDKLRAAQTAQNLGGNITVKINNNPRRHNTDVNGFPRYLCSFSAAKISVGAPKQEKSSEVPRLYTDFDGATVTELTAKHRLKEAGDCCSYCGTVVGVEDINGGQWLGKNEFLCPSCVKEYNIHEIFGGTVHGSQRT